MPRLLIKADKEVLEFYKNHTTYHVGDSGLDLFFPRDVVIRSSQTILINMGIKCEMLDDNGNNISYYIYPRSSIYKTPLILANSVGICDSGYRGYLMAAMRCVPSLEDLISSEEPYEYVIKKGERLLQICSPDLSPIVFELVDTLSGTSRGENGFGSTGK